MSALLSRLTAGLALLGSLGLAVIVVLTVLNTAAFLLDRIAEPLGGNVAGLSGYEELVQLLVGPSALCFFPYCVVKRGHVSVALLSAFFPGTLRKGTERLSDLTMGLLALFLAWMLSRGAFQSHSDGVITPVLGLPEWPFQLACVIALVLWSTVSLMLAANPEFADASAGADSDG